MIRKFLAAVPGQRFEQLTRPLRRLLDEGGGGTVRFRFPAVLNMKSMLLMPFSGGMISDG